MERTGNTIGAEGRRQHNENDPQNGDKPHMQERLADREIQEGLEELEESRAEGAEEREAEARETEDRETEDRETEDRETRHRQAPESLETSPQADGVPEDDNVGQPAQTEPTPSGRGEDPDTRT